MSFMFAHPVLLTLIALIVVSGCSPRLELAPVVTDEQRNSQYRLATVLPGPNNEGGVQSAPFIEQNDVVGAPKKAENNSHPLESAPLNLNPGSGSIQVGTEYDKAAKSGGSVAVADKGRPYEEPRVPVTPIAPPSQSDKEQTSPISKPNRKDQAGNTKNTSKLKEPVFNKNDRINPVSKQKTRTQTITKPSKTDYNFKENKKKSIVSIDNKNILMLHFQWPLKGKVRKQFDQTEKKGIDIAGRIGQTVRASETGKVVYSGQGLIGFGNLLIIKHNKEYLSAYASNGDLYVREGQHVSKGQDIAKLGAAVSKKAILHFEIRKNGKPVDPLSLLP